MSKKTEKVEVRISPELKQRLSAHSTSKNEAISQVIRRAIERELALGIDIPAGVKTMSSSLKFASPSFFAGVVALSVSGMLIAGSVQPATADAGVRMAFADLDHNQDGVIDRTEFGMGVIVSMDTKVADASFDKIEVVSGCGEGSERADLVSSQVTEAADIERTEALLTEEFARVDQNNDAEISFREFRQTQRNEMTGQFYSLDKDKNGRLSMTEYLGGFYVTTDFLSGAGCINGEFDSLLGTVVEGDAALTEQDLAKMQRVEFAAADVNLDGAITLEEFLSR